MLWHMLFLLLLLYFLQMVDRRSSGTNLSNAIQKGSISIGYKAATVVDISDVRDRKSKDLLCIRHGVSLANEFIGNRWGNPSFRDDPNLIDAALSEAGIQLTKTELAEQLLCQDDLRSFVIGTTSEDDGGGGVELVLVSPLTRCLQTYIYGVEPALSELFTKQDDKGINFSTAGDSDCRDGNHKSDYNSLRSKLPIPVLALPLLRERVYTASDTGRPVSVLEKEFPSINFSECHKLRKERQGLNGVVDDVDDVDDIWWYTGKETFFDENGTKQYRSIDNEYEEWRPHGEGQWYAVPGEPKPVFDRRMEELKDWLFKRKETKILLVAHWGVLRHLSDGIKWKNSEAKIIQLLPSSKL